MDLLVPVAPMTDNANARSTSKGTNVNVARMNTLVSLPVNFVNVTKKVVYTTIVTRQQVTVSVNRK
mgnify:FL=1